MHTNSPDQILKRLTGILFRRKRPALVVFTLCILASIAAILFLPRVYLSEAMVFVQAGRQSVTLDPTATTAPTVMLQKTQDVEVNSVLEVLSGRHIAQLVVDELGPDYVLEKDLKGNFLIDFVDNSLSKLGTLFDRFSPGESAAPNDSTVRLPTKAEELAIHRLRKKTYFHAPKDSTVVTIAAKAGSPIVAQKIAQTFTETFLREHVRINRTEGSLDFFEAQTSNLGDQLLQAQTDLEREKNEHNILSVEGKREVLQNELRDVELDLLRTDRELVFARAKMRDLQAAAKSMEQTMVTEAVDGFPNEARDRMREQLYRLEIKERDLRQTYVDTNPMVTTIEAQRKELETILNQEPEKRVQEKNAINPNWQAIALDMKRQEVETNAIAAQKTKLSEQLASLNKDLRLLNRREVEFATLQRKVDLAESNFRSHADRLEQARIDAALGNKQISNISVVEPASIVMKAAFPKKRITMMAGILVGLCAAIATALLFEYFDSTIRSREQVEFDLGLPVLLTVPPGELKAQRNIAKKRFTVERQSRFDN